MFEHTDIVVVHYKFARPTVATLNELLRHYPEAEVTLVDNSGGGCAVAESVLPHMTESAAHVRVLVNEERDEGPMGGLSHGAGIDLARRNSDRRYLISMESDTIVLKGGGIEYLEDLMAQGYDYAALGQKPIGNEFASFSPAFGIFRVDLLRAYDLSFRRRRRAPENCSADDLIIRHHLLAAEQAELGLPLAYQEGKPPDTYERPRERIVRTELDHLHYFDTGEWVHYFLSRKGYHYSLFPPLETVCHVWGSRDEKLFLPHFNRKLPHLDINGLLPPALHIGADS